MGYKEIQQIPAPEEIISEIPMTESLKKIKVQRDNELKKIFTGEDNRFIVIIGPCSASDENAVCD